MQKDTINPAESDAYLWYWDKSEREARVKSASLLIGIIFRARNNSVKALTHLDLELLPPVT